MNILLVMCVVEFWILLGLLSTHLFSYRHNQRIQITNISFILLSAMFGPISYLLMVYFYKGSPR